MSGKVLTGILLLLLGVAVAIVGGWVPRPARLTVRGVGILLALLMVPYIGVTVYDLHSNGDNSNNHGSQSSGGPDTSHQDNENGSQATTGDSPSTPTTPSTSPGPTTQDGQGPDIEVSPSLAPQFLSDLQPVSTAAADIEQGDDTIDGHDYPNSVWLCSDLEPIANIYCDSSTTPAWADYNIAPGDTTFKATIGFSGKSPSDCDVTAQVFADGTQLFSRELHYGDSIPITEPVTSKLRLRVQISPVKGMTCATVFGNANLTP